jgi:hypothetical protein
MIRSLTLFALLFAAAFVCAQERSIPCCNCDPTSRPADAICLRPDQIRDRVRHIEPLRPSGLDKGLKLVGTLVVEVRIDADGKVECANAIEGNPIAISAAMLALPKWTFKTFVKNGPPRPACGRLKIRYRLSDKASSTKLER